MSQRNDAGGNGTGLGLLVTVDPAILRKNSTCRKTTCRTLCSVWATPAGGSQEPSRYDTERKPLEETVWFETYQIDAGITR
ncbi:MAG: hypothetical protein ACLSFT_10580 [Ruminococcus callidus]